MKRQLTELRGRISHAARGAEPEARQDQLQDKLWRWLNEHHRSDMAEFLIKRALDALIEEALGADPQWTRLDDGFGFFKGSVADAEAQKARRSAMFGTDDIRQIPIAMISIADALDRLDGDAR